MTWPIIPVDGQRKDWPRLVATAVNRLQNTALAASGTATWGSITGTLASQSDLTSALAGKQAADSDLTALAALSGTNTIYYRSAANTWSAVTIGTGLSFSGGTLANTGTGGTVTTVSVVSANGFAGSVANASTTPAITITTSITGLLKGNGTAISAAASGTDYVAPGAATGSGLTMATNRLLGRTTASTGAIEEISLGVGLAASAGVLGASFRGALAKKSASQTAANYSAGSMIAWDAEVYDTDSIHDNSTNNSRLTVPSGVSYVRLKAQVYVDLNNGSGVYAELAKNGSLSFDGKALAMLNLTGENVVRFESPVLSVSAGDYFEVKLTIPTDTSVTVYSTTTLPSWFAMEIIA